jgi:hypothetical protein
VTEVATNADRKTKRMRRTARMLALIWAACWTVASVGLLLPYVAFSCAKQGETSRCYEGWGLLYPPIVGFIYLLTWVPTAIAWRWETAGGVMLVLTGGLCLVPAAANLFSTLYEDVLPRDLQHGALLALLSAFALLLFSGPPLAAGSLLLASRRRSKSPDDRPVCE